MFQRQQWSVGFLGFVVLFGLLILSSQRVLATSEVKVGLVVPLTGKLAPFGKSSQAACEIAADLINKAGGVKGLGGAKVVLLAVDSGSDPTSAGSAAQRLLSREKVSAVIGCFASSLSLAASEVTERNRVPFLTMSFTDKLTERGFKYIFQVVPKATVIGAAQITQAIDIGKRTGHPVKRVAILFEDTAYGGSQADGLDAKAKEAGIEVTLKEGYPSGITDVTSIIQKLRMVKADIVEPVSYFTDAVLIIRSMRQAGLTTPVFGGAAGYVIPEFSKTLGDLADGVFSVNTSNYDHYGEIGDIYRKKVGKFMPHEAFEHAVCLYAITAAMDDAKTLDPEKLGPALHKINLTTMPAAGLPGGGIKFDASGLNILAYPITAQWQKGEMVSVWPEGYAKGQPYWPK
ncbi:MAG: ABC transporter substrate-binding protein [Desulfomonilaceae bacterium]